MRYLGLDLGTTTLGVSISNVDVSIVSPYTLITFKSGDYNDALNQLMAIIEKEHIREVVLGYPKNMDNTLGEAVDRTLNFKQMLEDKGVVVHLEDERLTTVEALKLMRDANVRRKDRKKKTDIIAAVLILEMYLKRRSNEQVSDTK